MSLLDSLKLEREILRLALDAYLQFKARSVSYLVARPAKQFSVRHRHHFTTRPKLSCIRENSEEITQKRKTVEGRLLVIENEAGAHLSQQD